jgi:hypothetical protein
VHLKQITSSLAADGFDLKDWLNSRFGATSCNAAGAPPDSNVREFYGAANGYPQYTAPTAATISSTFNNVKRVIAVPDLAISYPTATQPTLSTDPSAAADFGPIWIYNKPTGNFTYNDWPKMYQYTPPGKPLVQVAKPSSYSTPYKNNLLAPSGGGGVDERRVLNIPLLDCSGGAPGSKAKVLAVGRFFMTAKASDTVIPGEFAGTVKNPINAAVLFR